MEALDIKGTSTLQHAVNLIIERYNGGLAEKSEFQRIIRESKEHIAELRSMLDVENHDNIASDICSIRSEVEHAREKLGSVLSYTDANARINERGEESLADIVNRIDDAVSALKENHDIYKHQLQEEKTLK